MSNRKISILAVQGSVAEHATMCRKIGAEVNLVRNCEDLTRAERLIIPGGESTTVRKLCREFGLLEMLESRVRSGNLPIFGTCAGAILISEIFGGFSVKRNAFGGQQESFSTKLESAVFPDLEGIFIRAPRFEKVGDSVRVLAKFREEPVLISGRNFLAASFHPECTSDFRIHEYFLREFSRVF